MKKTWMMLALIAAVLLAAMPAWASLPEATGTLTEGAVEFPVGLVKLVGGALWTVGEVIVLPFRLLF